MMDTGISIARIELLDELQMDAVNKYAGLDYEVAPTLFFEFHGSAYTVSESSEIAGKIAAAPRQWRFPMGNRRKRTQTALASPIR